MKTSVFHRFTVQTLKQNRTRTLVTIIGIALSMALLTAIFEAMYSGIAYMIRSETSSGGTYHGLYTFMTQEEAETLRSMKEVKETGTLQVVGKVEAEESYIDQFLILGWEESIGDLARIQVTEGRMPENSSEILLNTYLGSSYAKEEGFDYELGDSITLTVTAAKDGSDWGSEEDADGEDGEKAQEQRTFTICGYYYLPNYNLSDGWQNGLLITGPGAEAVQGQSEADQWVFFTLKHPARFWKFGEKAGFSNKLIGNDYLLIYYGSNGNETILQLAGVFVGVLILLIAVGTISMIYNSFAISVSERTRQFGMLKSVGATRGQIRRSVLWEAVLLCLIGIPAGMIIGCLGIGITLYLLKGQFEMIRGTASENPEQLKLVLNAGALAVSAVICFVITMIAALIPAMRAVMISPMEAIRQSRDVQIREKDVRTSKLRTKLFGFEGMMAAKNFKRNRKRYRTTVISLAVSVVLFISATAFTSYLTSSAGLISDEDMGYDLQAYVGARSAKEIEEYEEAEKIDYSGLLEEIRALGSIEEATYLQSIYTSLSVDASGLSEDWKQYGFPAGVNVILLEDETFRLLAAANRLNVAQFYNPMKPSGIVLNEVTLAEHDGDGRVHWRKLQLLDESKLPLTIDATVQVIPEGYDVYDTEERNGVVWYYLYPSDLMMEYYDGMVYDEEKDEFTATVRIDESKIEKLPEEALLKSHEITAAAVITDRPYYLDAYTGLQLIMPYSIGSILFAEAGSNYNVSYLAVAEDHAKGAEEMQKLLDEKELGAWVNDRAAGAEQIRALVRVLNVFSYGFIILIALISVTNVFNTISTNVMIRKREYAMLRSVGMTEKGIRKMTNYECLIYGWKSLSWGLVLSAVIVFFMYRLLGSAVTLAFRIPWGAFAIASFSVFAVVFVTMLYATNRLKKDNLVETLRSETA